MSILIGIGKCEQTMHYFQKKTKKSAPHRLVTLDSKLLISRGFRSDFERDYVNITAVNMCVCVDVDYNNIPSQFTVSPLSEIRGTLK